MLLLLLFPLSFICLLPFAWLISLLVPLPTWLIALTYFVAVALLFIPGVERALAPRLMGVRHPTADEKERLDRLWQGVLQRSDASTTYLLRVVDSEHLNAFAAQAHVVAVTTTALELPDEELEAILAHELGHHFGLHPVLGMIQLWFMMPIGAAVVAGSRLAALASAISGMFVGWAALFGFVIAGIVWVAALALNGIALVAELIFRAFGRQSEHQADEIAVRIGYGPGLLRAFDHFEEIEAGERDFEESGLMARFAASHPETRDRRARVTRLLDLS